MPNEPLRLTLVVFDVNVYLDAAVAVGPPFSWKGWRRRVLIAETTLNSPALIERREWQRLQSLLAIHESLSGSISMPGDLQVWTSEHIIGLVRRKAEQPDDAILPAEDRGLGWPSDVAIDLLDFVDDVVDRTSGGWDDRTGSENAPPLSHEDGRVLWLARFADPDPEPARRIVVTNDRDFRQRGGTDRVDVLYPREYRTWLRNCRAARSRRH